MFNSEQWPLDQAPYFFSSIKHLILPRNHGIHREFIISWIFFNLITNSLGLHFRDSGLDFGKFSTTVTVGSQFLGLGLVLNLLASLLK